MVFASLHHSFSRALSLVELSMLVEILWNCLENQFSFFSFFSSAIFFLLLLFALVLILLLFSIVRLLLFSTLVCKNHYGNQKQNGNDCGNDDDLGCS